MGTTARNNESMGFGLKRIILIDSFFKKCQRVAIDVDGHASLSGTNGSGKTSLEKLIPFFYGAEPAKLENRAAGKSSFLDWYLPRSSSLLIFEYMRDSGLCCVVVHRHISGTKPVYRFVSGDFDEDLFSIANGKGKRRYFRGTELPQHWREQNQAFSKQLEVVVDYRAIIQNDRHLLLRSAAARELRPLARQYCLGNSQSHMQHMEKITEAILGREGRLDRIQGMLATIMEEEGSLAIPTPPYHKDNLVITDDVASIRTFKRESVFAEVVKDYHEYIDLQKKMKSLSFTLNLEITRLEKEKIQLQEDLEKQSQVLKDLESGWTNNRQELVDQCQDSKGRLHSREKDRDILQNAYDRYEELDMAARLSDYENLPTYISQREQCKTRLDQLTSNVENIRAEFNEQRITLGEQYSKNYERLNKKLMQTREKRHQNEITLNEKLRQLQYHISRQIEDVREKANVERYLLVEELAQAKVAEKSIGPTEEENKRLEIALFDIDNKDAEIEAQEKRRQESDDAQCEAANATDQAQQAFSTARTRVEKEKRAVDNLRKLLFPISGTLLGRLRENDPTWVNTVGKIIRPELLERSDLGPTFSIANNLLYGWELNLHKIDQPEFAQDEESLKQRFYEQESRRKLSEDVEQEKGKELEQARTQLQAAEAVLNVEQRKFKQLQQERDTLRQNQDHVRREIKEAASSRRIAAKKQVEKSQSKLRRFDARLAERVQQLREELEEAESEVSGNARLTELSLETVINQTTASIEELKERHTKDHRTLDSDYRQACSEKGVDQKTLDEAEQNDQQAKNRVAGIEAMRTEIMEYSDWVKFKWPNMTTVNASIQEERACLSKAEENLQAEEAKYKETRKAHKEKIGELETALRGVREGLEQAQSALRSLGASPEEGDVLALSLPILIEEANRAIKVIGKTEQRIRNAIHKIENIMGKFSLSQIARGWEQLRKATARTNSCDIDSPDLVLYLPTAVDELISKTVPYIEGVLVETIRTIGYQLAQFHDALNEMDTRIVSQAIAINHSIDVHNKITALDDIRVNLVSKVKDESYWESLAGFRQAWDDWVRTGSSELPDRSITSAFSDALAKLQENKVTKELRSLFKLSLHLTENGRSVSIHSDTDLSNASSNGLSYLALCSIFVGIVRLLCKDKAIKIHWPVDELGIISLENVALLFEMLDEANIGMIGGFPNSDPDFLQYFHHPHHIDIETGVRLIKTQSSGFAGKVAARKATQSVVTDGGAA